MSEERAFRDQIRDKIPQLAHFFGSSLSSQMLLLKVAEELMTLAYENGINLFDTAEVYNSGK